MANIDQKTVSEIALLARLNLTDQEKSKYQAELSAILGYVEMLNEVNTEKVEPTAQVTGLSDVVRNDEKIPSKLSREEIISNAPEKKDGYIKVKSVLE